MLKFLFRLALKHNLPGTLRLASRLEYGAGIFCAKLAKRAADDGYVHLSSHLAKQFTEEDSHARMLGGLVDGKNRLNPNCPTGIWKKGIDFDALDGISDRYWAAKLFFWFAKPQDLPWHDILAAIYVIETVVMSFYEVLAESEKESVAAIAFKILADETEHADYLKHCLFFFHCDSDGVIFKWQDRLPLAMLGGAIDFLSATVADFLSCIQAM